MSAHLPGTFPARIGPQLVGILLTALSTGVALVQTQHYYEWSASDPLLLRAGVGLLCALTVVSLFTNSAYLYEVLITHFSDYAFQALDPPVFVVNFMLVPFEIAIGQSFFCWRQYAATKSVPVTVFISLLICVAFAANLVVGACAAGADANLARATQIKIITTAIQMGAWVAAGADIILCGVFVWKLRAFITADKTGNDSVLKALLSMAVSTTLFTTILSLGNALSTKLESSATSHYQLLFSYMIPYSYQMSVLFVLNSRRRLRLIQEGKSSSNSGGGFTSRTGGISQRFQFQLGTKNGERGDTDVQVSFPMDSFTPTDGHVTGGVTVDVEKSMHIEDDASYDRV